MRPLAILLLALTVAACGTTGRSAITAYYLDTDGVVKNYPIYLHTQPSETAKTLCDLDCIGWMAQP